MGTPVDVSPSWRENSWSPRSYALAACDISEPRTTTFVLSQRVVDDPLHLEHADGISLRRFTDLHAEHHVLGLQAVVPYPYGEHRSGSVEVFVVRGVGVVLREVPSGLRHARVQSEHRRVGVLIGPLAPGREQGRERNSVGCRCRPVHRSLAVQSPGSRVRGSLGRT